MKKLFSLGELYVSDFVEKQDDRKKFELALVLDEKNRVRLSEAPPPEMMWGKYWYKSGISDTMRRHLSDVVQSVENLVRLQPEDTWLDIASNDGTLLSYVDSTLYRIGVDPCEDRLSLESKKHANEVIQNYFSKELLGTRRAKVVTTIAMFYDLQEPEKFIRDVHSVLTDDGLWCFQMSYTPLMLKQMAFDNICHEHFFYYSLQDIKKMLEANGFRLLNCTLNDANGGSFRVFAVKDTADVGKFASKQLKDVFDFNVTSLLEYEKTLKLDSEETWHNFFAKLEELKHKTVNFLKDAKRDGKRVFGYGASTKGNTLLQYFGITSDLLECLVERSPAKFGLRTIGTDIPIISEEEARNLKPDYMLVLPWHFIDEFRVREKSFLDGGGQFIVPCPEFAVIGAV